MRKILAAVLCLVLAQGIGFADETLQRGRQLWTDSNDSSPTQEPFSEITVGSGLALSTAGVLTGTGGGITISTTTITSGTDTRVLFDDGGTVGEDGGFTYNKTNDIATLIGGLLTNGTIEIQASVPTFKWTPTTGDAFEGVAVGSVFRVANTTDGITSLIHYASNIVGLGEPGFAPSKILLTTDGTGNDELQVPPNSISLGEVFITNSPTDGQFLSFNAATGNWEWASSSGSGDITSVGDVASGAAFDGTQGTTLTFNNAGGDATLDFDGTDLQSSHRFNISSAIPIIDWTDTTASEDDFEAVAQTSVFRVSNTTDNITSLIHYASNAVGLGETGFAPTEIVLITDGTGDGEIKLPASSIGYSEVTFDLPVREIPFPPGSFDLLESAYPPPEKITGTTQKTISYGFDDTTDEFVGGSFIVPSDVESGSIVTFRLFWRPRTAAATDTIWAFEHYAADTGETWDGGFTTETSGASTGSASTGFLTELTWTENLSNLAWTASDLVRFRLSRDANHASDNLVGDALFYYFQVEIRRA